METEQGKKNEHRRTFFFPQPDPVNFKTTIMKTRNFYMISFNTALAIAAFAITTSCDDPYQPNTTMNLLDQSEPMFQLGAERNTDRTLENNTDENEKDAKFLKKATEISMKEVLL